MTDKKVIDMACKILEAKEDKIIEKMVWEEGQTNKNNYLIGKLRASMSYIMDTRLGLRVIKKSL